MRAEIVLGEEIRQTALYQNFPNPFNPAETRLPYQLAQDADVCVTIYNTSGHQIRTFNLGIQPGALYLAKEKTFHWDGRDDGGELVPGGIYLYQLRAGDFAETMKMTIHK